MKQLLLLVAILAAAPAGFAQSYRTETVEWLHPKLYKAKSVTFVTDSVNLTATNCKILEFKTISGVTGYYIEGDIMVRIETKQLSEKCTAVMLRFNPLDRDSLITTENIKEITDDDFMNESLNVLKTTFRHCYHSGMDAIIPDPGVYAVNFFSPRIGEVLVSADKKEIIYYNFTIRTKM